MSWTLLDEDPLTLTREYFIDNGDGSFTIATEEDYGPLLQSNHEQRMHHGERDRWGEGRIHSRIPPTVMFDLMKRGILGPDMDANTPAMTRWVNSSENIWKIRSGRV